ncbi:hypothetical protein NQ314_008969 [Rhamnusium bicolor]|uniref:C2H2-type domain-containing protein n=1 Tax=Rhamnusium bicolor TaxID=1586634 RepID=A0AAV8Y5G7_9CUCU|nr:hypothetical protein NQ314_008969 [Rhamnusium bicolor]
MRSSKLLLPLKAVKPNSHGLFVCPCCAHQTNRRHSLNKHFMTHMKPDDTRKFNCDQCNYESRWKGALKIHMLCHKNPLEIEMFQCAECFYKTKYKKHLQRHVKVHMNPDFVKTYCCDYCSFKSIDFTYFKQHNRTKHEIEVTSNPHKCHLCSYQTRYEININIHKEMKHGIKMPKMNEHECPYCTYKSDRFNNFKGHLKKHKNCDKRPTHKCTMCAFETKRKFTLKNHLIRHEPGHQLKKRPYKMVYTRSKVNANVKPSSSN